MTNSIELTEIEIENTVVLKALIDALKKDDALVAKLKKAILEGVEAVDTRNEVEVQATAELK